jgi:CubicO group peptidase (beta-lactamase class C family)
VTDIQGHTADGWGKVADAFRSSFEQNRELGSAVAVYAGGKPVVDLWAGVADGRTGRPWTEDTVAVVFSTTKGATALCANMLVESGQLDLDAPVARYWPEFGAAGKENVLVRWLLSHRTGLPAMDVDLTLEEVCAWDPVIKALEAQRPYWTPGEQHLYHGITYGFLVGEVVRRVTGKTLGTFFADEIAGPLGLDAWIGLPAAVEPRVAHLVLESPPPDMAAHFEQAGVDSETARLLAEAAATSRADPDSVFARAGTLGGAYADGLVTEEGGHNARIVRASEQPGTNMVSDARSLARMYAATTTDVDGVRLLQPETVAAMSASQTLNSTPYGPPPVLDDPSPYGVGVWRSSRFLPLLGPRSFGHPGAGGSLGFGDPAAAIGFGYVTNYMLGDPTWGRVNDLVAAVAECTG